MYVRILRGPAALEVGRLEVRHEVDRGREVGPVAGLGGGDPERDREMALADPRRSQEQRVAALLDEAQGGQLGDDRPVDRGLEVELELGQALVERVVGEAQPSRQPAGRGRLDLGREQALEDLDRRRRSRCWPARARPRGARTPWRGRDRRGARGSGRRRSRPGTPARGSSGELGVDREGPDLDGLARPQRASSGARGRREGHEGVLRPPSARPGGR